MSEKPGGALSRWSQRKHAARVAARGSAAPAALRDTDEPVVSGMQPQPAPDVHASLPADTAADAERKPEGAPSESRPPLTPLEELTADSDYTQFLAEHVPEALRRAALRKLWTSDPVLACLDGLNDYDEDYNVIDTVISAADTNYKIGRGYLEVEEPKAAETHEPTVETPRQAESAEAAPESTERPAETAADEKYSPDLTDEHGARQLVTDAAEEAPSNSPHDNLTGSKG